MFWVLIGILLLALVVYSILGFNIHRGCKKLDDHLSPVLPKSCSLKVRLQGAKGIYKQTEQHAVRSWISDSRTKQGL